MNVTAVITAGGSGKRFGTPTPKQFLPLLGLPILVRSVQAFERCTEVEEIVITVPEAQLASYNPSTFHSYDIRKVVKAIVGGESRQESVHLGLRAIDWPCDVVAIHDASRPLIHGKLISASLLSLEGWDGSVVAVPVHDTLKEVSSPPKIDRTVERTHLWAMQTPQVFRFPWILKAYDQAAKDSFRATDDAQVAERFGGKVRVLEGDPRNLKITFNNDLRMAEALLKGEVE
ncbi:MAG TPA: 2-C-methyl-D-erythritol 4-phosphate cytidylyltransferase [Bdellovibrionota bacterium]|nr:2-C-methyl-D-erythritol 4-phosphate cytidylyltransferase [Bdellovibrionota bacterium]